METPSSEDHVDRMLRAWRTRAPEIDVAPLALAGRVLRVAALLEARLEGALGDLDLTLADFDVLNTVRREAGEDGMQPTALAREALLTSGAMTSRLTRLERRGLLTREADGADRRAIRVRLTPEGLARAEAALDVVLGVDREAIRGLGAVERDATVGGLRSMLAALDGA